MDSQLKEEMTQLSEGQVIDLSRLYGETECQLSEGGEAELKTHFKHCKKNPGHQKFIPVKDFKLEHLPEQFQDNDLYEWIKAEAELTVRIKVDLVSPNRPKFFPGTEIPYPFYNIKGSDKMLRTGSGSFNVLKYVNGRGYGVMGNKRNKLGHEYKRQKETCPCENCAASNEPSRTWWEIIVNTATHVVFDDIEAEHTSIRLGFDENICEKQTYKKFKVYEADIQNDWCKLKHVTCDAQIGEKFSKTVLREDMLEVKVRKKFMNVPNVNLICIVSHPHGCTKQISIGESKDVIRNINHAGEYSKHFEMTKLVYTTMTCPGSSGARVFSLTSDNSHVHNGAFNSGFYSGFNCSSFGPFRLITK